LISFSFFAIACFSLNVGAKVGVGSGGIKKCRSFWQRFFAAGFYPRNFAQKSKEKAMAKAKDVIISSSSVNSYKMRVLTSGLDIAQYQRNPILLWQHNRPWRGTTDEVLPIGRMESVRVEGDNLMGTPVFDEGDDFAKKIKAKWEAGFLKMASVGIEILETSSDASLMLPGQLRPTVTKAKVREVSIVDIGANDDALALYHDGKFVCLSDNGGGDLLDAIIPKIKTLTTKKNQMNMKTVALKLGLAESATEGDVLAAIGTLQSAAATVAKLQQEVEAQREAAIASEVDAALKLKKITADKRSHFISLGKTSGIELLRATLECITPAVKPTDVIKLNGGAAAGGAKEYAKLSEVPPEEFAELKKNDKKTYRKLYKAEYGVEADF
jgi:hypothetical protein